MGEGCVWVQIRSWRQGVWSGLDHGAGCGGVD